MAKFEEVLAPGITIRESANDGSDFTNPTADYRRLFLGEDGYLHVKDSSGTVTDPYTGGGGGAVATDAIWDAAGDLAVGSGANTAAKLSIASANGMVLQRAGGAVAWGYTPFIGCKAYHNTTQGSVGASITALSLNSYDYDTSSFHDNSTFNTRLTVPITGYYRFTGHAMFAQNATCILGLRVDGTTQVRGSAVGGDGAAEKYSTTAVILLTASQYVELWGYQSSSGNVGDAANGENMTSLECQFLGV